MNAPLELIPVDTMPDELVLHALEADMPQECDYKTACSESVEWEACCRFEECFALLCNTHQRKVSERQRRLDEFRRTQRCPACGGVGLSLFTFTPVRSRDQRKLW